VTDGGTFEGTRWPTGTEYSAAVQQPSTSFADLELRAATLTVTPLGLPAMASGQNAIAFHLKGSERPLAVRCLLHANDDGRVRYNALRAHVEALEIPAVVAATWHDEGIRVHGRWWPVVVMPWVAGAPLHIAIRDRLGDPSRLTRLADRWLDLVEVLQDHQFAHGDLQHGNVLLTDDDEFHLVDLDGVWVPNMGVGAPDEYGHPNYQHVNRSDVDWGPFVDTFSALVIALSMVALAADPALERLLTDESLLLSKRDFEAPDATEIWRTLADAPYVHVRDLAARVHALARHGRPSMVSVRDALAAPLNTAPANAANDISGDPGPLPGGASDVDVWWTGRADSPQPPPAVTNGQFENGPQARAVSSGVAQPPGLATFTGHPVLAGITGGAVAGLIGALVAGVLQAISPGTNSDGGIFFGVIAGMLGGVLHSWPALNLASYRTAGSRFLIGASVGLLAGILAVVLGDIMSKTSLDAEETSNAIVVGFVWAVIAALVGLATGLLQSPKAGAYAFTGGAVAGFVGGLLHGATSAEFDQRVLLIRGFSLDGVVVATVISMVVGLAIAIAIREARLGSLTVVGGPGHGSVIDFHSSNVMVGSGARDTVALAGNAFGPNAIRLEVGDEFADVNTDIAVALDGVTQPARFTLRSGQVLAFAGHAIRVDTRTVPSRETVPSRGGSQ
jgi:hypothetical protein